MSVSTSNLFKISITEATPANFSGAPDTEREKINTWVSEQTRNKINDVLDEGTITDTTRMVLVNAIYFKGENFSV